MSYSFLNTVALILTIVGGLNWGLVGIADFNLVTFLLGSLPPLVTITYALVGASALYLAALQIRDLYLYLE